MIVSCFLLFVNRLRVARSAAAGGRSSDVELFRFGLGKSTSYKASGAAIGGVPATSVPRENPRMKPLADIGIYAATGVVAASSPKYTSSGVQYSRA
jgi:hypothetical protein